MTLSNSADNPKPRILYMEDDEALAQLVQRRLSHQEYDVEIAPDGLVGLEKLKTTPFDVVVLDYRMPKLDGLAVLDRIMEDKPSLPAIMVSGFGSLEIAIEAIHRGAADYVVKEAGNNYLALLRNTIERVLEKQRLIQGKKKIEAALLYSELQFRFITHSASDAILSANEDGCLTFWNRGATTIFGYHEDEVLGRSLTLLIPERDHEAHLAAMNRVKKTGRMSLAGQILEVLARRKDGTEFPLEISLSSWAVNGKRFFSAVARDITLRKKAEQRTQRLLQNQILINTLLQQSVTCSHSLDEQLGIALNLVLSASWLVTLNKGAIFLYDDERRELVLKIHKGIQEPLLKTCARVGSHQCLCGLAMASTQLVFADSSDERHSTHCEGMSPHSQYCVPIIARERFLGILNIFMPKGHIKDPEEGELLNTVANTLAGIIERKQLDERLQRALIAADTANNEKSRFLASMSHEIRTPMNVVLGMAELLLETPLDAVQRRFAQTMQSSGKTLMGVINDILDFSRIEAGNLPLVQVPYSPRQMVEETTLLMQTSAVKKGLVLGVVTDLGVPDTVLGDDGRVRQVLINLIGNAIKFTHAGRVDVHMSVHPVEPETLLFQVSDTGIGIAPEMTEHIFKHFTQADAGITRRYGGTGLGLAISRCLVELMGGRITVASRPGEGSVFSFTLPMKVVQSSSSQNLSAVLEKDVAVKPLRILLAEDTEENLILFEAYLAQTPYHLKMVNNGVEAVLEFQKDIFDVIIMDVEMPKLDGYSATRQIRKWEQAMGRLPVPIIALSAHAMEGEKERSQEAGCTLYLSKPVRKKMLLDVLHHVATSG
ncbi:MAG: response regulator [Magnetococcales bacterium]|nr:response regulator [Magnetococcales bacterium]MBF0151143.1 response regulator [Magnetococcales bacterium]MBF0172543.1 response regulator [Magnetococcales bacterium]MBF0347069.1 response regulator [Magnetococcales bacterium]MBF0629996.1 response regulator [Magnetococcales bacterium]